MHLLMLDNLEIVREQFKSDAYANHFGIVLDALTNDTIQMHMQLKPEMNNLFARPHGGAIYALADAAFSVIANNANNLSVALDCSITYHNSPEPGEILTVHGELITGTKRTGSYLFKIKDSKGILVATMKSIVYRTGKPIKVEKN